MTELLSPSGTDTLTVSTAAALGVLAVLRLSASIGG